MKTAVIPQVRVGSELRAELDSMLLPGESIADFVEASVRRAVELRRVQTDFAARCGSTGEATTTRSVRSSSSESDT